MPSREKRRLAGNPPREEGRYRAGLLSWLKPRPTVRRRMRCRPGARLVFVVVCPKLGLARGGVGCQGGVRVVFLGSALRRLCGLALQDFVNVAGVAGNVGGPRAESAVTGDRAHPFAQELALGLLFLIVLSFHFKDQTLPFASRTR